MRKWPLYMIILATVVSCLAYTDTTEARGIPAVDLNLVPTANTLGKGGYSLSVGMIPYDADERSFEPMNVDIGGFFKEELL